MNLIKIISICFFLSYLIKRNIKKLNLKGSVKNYIDSLVQFRKFSDDLNDLKYSLNKLSKTGSILILKLILFSLPYFILFLVINLIQISNPIMFIIPLFPYSILLLNGKLS